MIFNKIHVFVRQTNHHKPNNNRPNWFSYEKVFQNLLKTSNPNLIDITVVFDGDIKNHFTEKYSGFEIIPINAPPPGNFTSIIKLCEIIKEKNLSENTIIYILENDYVHVPYWAEILLDLYNTTGGNHYTTLFDHGDLYLFRQDRSDHFGMYRNWRPEVIVSRYRHWKTVQLACSCYVMSKKIFDEDCGILSQGLADNTTYGIITKRSNRVIWSPAPSLSTHSEIPFIAPVINWEYIINERN